MSIALQLVNAQPERFDYCAGIGSGGCVDLDTLIERYGKFLAIENKCPGESISTGQFRTLRALARQEGWTVWIVWGEPPAEISSLRELHPTSGMGDEIKLDVHDLRERIQVWWDEVRP